MDFFFAKNIRLAVRPIIYPFPVKPNQVIILSLRSEVLPAYTRWILQIRSPLISTGSGRCSHIWQISSSAKGGVDVYFASKLVSFYREDTSIRLLIFLASTVEIKLNFIKKRQQFICVHLLVLLSGITLLKQKAHVSFLITNESLVRCLAQYDYVSD